MPSVDEARRLPLPLVSIVMPIKDEIDYIDASINAIDDQTYPADRIEILIVDGGSTDGTIDEIERRVRNDLRFALLGGPGVNTPLAMNLGIEASRGQYVAKVDGHGYINPVFIEESVRIMQDDPLVGCVGGEIVPIARTTIERAIRIARFSKLGVGGGIYTAGRTVHNIDTVQCGVYRRDALVAIGMFDPAMAYGEDEEVNHRLRRYGQRIVFQPAMQFRYQVRPSLRSLFRQYRNYGRARVAVVRKHPTFLRLKHLAPAGLVVIVLASVVLGVVVDGRIALTVVGAYLAAIALGGVALSIAHRFPRPDLVAASLAALHWGYGLGTLRGAIGLVRPKR
jgi:glycosyltransferase involved in cell wall biosynthesis